MADNPDLPASGIKALADDITQTNGVGHASAFGQRLKVDSKGVDGSHTDASRAAPFPVEAGITVRSAAGTFTRPADTTAYTIGDLVANSTTAGSVTVLTFANAVRTAGGGGMVRRAKLKKSGTSVTNASFRLHLFAAAPGTITNGDNGAFSVSGAADYLGALDVTCDRAFTDGAVGFGIPAIGGEINLDIPSTGTTLYGLLEARAAYTPTSGETFSAELEIVQD